MSSPEENYNTLCTRMRDAVNLTDYRRWLSRQQDFVLDALVKGKPVHISRQPDGSIDAKISQSVT